MPTSRPTAAPLLAAARAGLELTPFYLSLTRGLAAALVRRALRGRRHEHWTLSYELAMTALRVASQEHTELTVTLVRSQVAPIPRELLGKVEITSAEVGGVQVEIHTPRAQADGAPVLLYLHGGGFITCSPRSHRDVIARISHASGARCIAPYYRLAPEHPFPAALDDVFACYLGLLAQGHAPERLFVGGDSAGGGLALSLLLRLREAGVPLPRAAVLLSPWLDLTLGEAELSRHGPHDYHAAARLPRNAAVYAGDQALHHPLISPVHAQLAELPPLLVQTGEWEIFCEQNERFVRLARAAGVEVEHTVAPGMLHAFTCFAGLTPQGRAAVTAIGRFVRQHAST